MIIFGEKPIKVKDPETGKKVDEYFKPSKAALMKDPKKLLAKILRFAKEEKENIKAKVMKKLKKEVVSDPNFSDAKCKNAGAAILGLFYFSNAMYGFKSTFDKTAPLRATLRE
jgi:dynein heavy chain